MEGVQMKPFYSIQELANILGEDVCKVVDGLIGYGLTPIYDGKKADLSRWERPKKFRSGDTVFVSTGGKRDTGPDPEDVVVATDMLPDIWKNAIQLDDAASDGLIAELVVPAIPDAASSSWQDKARAIADELDATDAKNSAHDSLTSIADRVAEKLRGLGAEGEGPRGPLAGGTILREALQGGQWQRKARQGKQG